MLTVFFPGMGADSTLARYHRLARGDSLWIDWPAEIPDRWDALAAALRPRLPPRGDDVRFVGISFGGLAALRLAEDLRPAQGVLLLGSLIGPDELARPLRLGLALLDMLPTPLFSPRIAFPAAIRYWFGVRSRQECEILSGMARGFTARRIRAMCRLVRDWPGSTAQPAARLHGRHVRIEASAATRPPSERPARLRAGHARLGAGLHRRHGKVELPWKVVPHAPAIVVHP